ncbi:hypothetical protein GCM10009665_77830 [Kitasatospora nipponensis]|uniref:Uncharacterized protein n=1 Tax=Kitasatospora nipponensis TaxID=258049 RepID=A0ABN1TA67_9ACTN
MLLENVRSLDEAVEEVRDTKREAIVNRERQRLASRRERAEIRAINRQHGGWGRSRSAALAARQLEPGGSAEPAIAPPAPEEPALPAAAPGLPARPGRRAIDLTTDEDTMTLPRLDSLEQKLKDLEKQFG